MPYISDKVFKSRVGKSLVLAPRSRTSGELNFVLTKVLQRHDSNYDPQSYSHYNELVGVLECCKLELYRRMVAPYEDQKIQENGDVYQ